MPTAEKALAERATKARKLATSAQRKASTISADQSQNRTTRARHALQVKADALDKIGDVLAGKA